MRTNFFCTNFLNAPKGLGHPSEIPGTSQILSSKPKEDKLSREGTNFSATTPSRGRPPPGGLRTQKVNLCALLSFLKLIQKTREGCGCPKLLAGKDFWQILTLLEKCSPIFRKHEMLSLPRFGHFLARKMAAGKSAAPAGTLLDFLPRNHHSLLEFF